MRGRFRSFGEVAIVDHGDGWASLLTGLGALAVKAGDIVVAGAPLGAPRGEEPRATVSTTSPPPSPRISPRCCDPRSASIQPPGRFERAGFPLHRPAGSRGTTWA
ncbi:hypothetical protein AB5I41_06305 [Sphingomonas sp. MMS24-JH45]